MQECRYAGMQACRQAGMQAGRHAGRNIGRLAAMQVQCGFFNKRSRLLRGFSMSAAANCADFQ